MEPTRRAPDAGGSPPSTLAVIEQRDEVLSSVFRAEYANLVALARLLVDHRAEAEEIVQEAFARTYAGWDRLESPTDPLPYLRRAVVNLCRGGLRRRATARSRPVEEEGVAEGADAPLVLDESQREVMAALRQLPDRQRECVILRYLLDCSTAEAAAALDIAEGTVKTHLHRGLTTLATILGGTR